MYLKGTSVEGRREIGDGKVISLMGEEKKSASFFPKFIPWVNKTYIYVLRYCGPTVSFNIKKKKIHYVLKNSWLDINLQLIE